MRCFLHDQALIGNWFNRYRERASNLSALDRILLGLWTLFMNPRRIARSAVILKTSTLLRFHPALVKGKYRRLFSSCRKGKPGPPGPSQELIRAIVETQRRNPRYGCPRIALLVSKVFGVDIDKDVVRRVLAKHDHPDSSRGGPSGLTFIGHLRNRLWSIDLFRCESILLKTHGLLGVMDPFSRRIIGCAVQASDVDGVALCRMFHRATSGMGVPQDLSSDHDPLFAFHRWQANLRVLGVEELKTLPYVPTSHPFIERLIGTIRREYLDQVLFWSADDLERKLVDFQAYYNGYRVHYALEGNTPSDVTGEQLLGRAGLDHYRWTQHCRGLFQTPIAA